LEGDSQEFYGWLTIGGGMTPTFRFRIFEPEKSPTEFKVSALIYQVPNLDTFHLLALIILIIIPEASSSPLTINIF
jgi:hypothetical protein